MKLFQFHTHRSDRLKKEAVALGLCQQWQSEWDHPTDDELCEMYIRGLDFCIMHDFPKPGYMKRHFDGTLQRHGIFVDEVVSLKNPVTVVANGKCTGTIFVDGFSVSQVYVRHKSYITVRASGNAVVNVRCYDLCNVDIDCRDNAKVSVIRYGGSLAISGNVKVIDRLGSNDLKKEELSRK